MGPKEERWMMFLERGNEKCMPRRVDRTPCVTSAVKETCRVTSKGIFCITPFPCGNRRFISFDTTAMEMGGTTGGDSYT
jgi:hypothetical protein